MARNHWMHMDARQTECLRVVGVLLLLTFIGVLCGVALTSFASDPPFTTDMPSVALTPSWPRPAAPPFPGAAVSAGSAVPGLPAANFSAILPKGVVLDDFVFLGKGNCINQQGQNFSGPILRYTSTALPDGSSPECTKLCLLVPSCTGYEVQQAAGSCYIFADGLFHPSAARGRLDAKCFWRHPMAKDTKTAFQGQEVLPVPKIIWSYWSNRPDSPEVQSLFVEACKASWRALNPDYEIRLLDESSLHEFLTPQDLPRTFEFLTVQHKSDAIRLALLLRYGGVWVDATTLMTHSLQSLLGSDPQIRTFFSLPPIWEDESLRANDTRVDWKDHAYNWFLESPPNDLFIRRVRDCAWQFLDGASRHDLRLTGMFTPQQLEIMKRLGIRTYLSSDACIFRTIFEDRALWNWFHSPRVRIHNPTGRMGFTWMANMTDYSQRIFHRVDQELAEEFITDEGLFMKFTGDMRKAMVLPVNPLAIWCWRNTLRLVLDSIGVDSLSHCARSGFAVQQRPM
ncbi:unnamed protein product [Durusdinium trenchii]|uniref:Apple domain-containing protein n=2 Tax=Durusdinium trenchii TaxID=1381693 RepID=A0ABP0RB37_9DINO